MLSPGDSWGMIQCFCPLAVWLTVMVCLQTATSQSISEADTPGITHVLKVKKLRFGG